MVFILRGETIQQTFDGLHPGVWQLLGSACTKRSGVLWEIQGEPDGIRAPLGSPEWTYQELGNVTKKMQDAIVDGRWV